MVIVELFHINLFASKSKPASTKSKKQVSYLFYGSEYNAYLPADRVLLSVMVYRNGEIAAIVKLSKSRDRVRVFLEQFYD